MPSLDIRGFRYKFNLDKNYNLVTDKHWNYALDIFNSFIKFKYIKKNYGGKTYISRHTEFDLNLKIIDCPYICSYFYNKNTNSIYQCFIYSDAVSIQVYKKTFNDRTYNYYRYIEENNNNNQIENFIKADSVRQCLM